MTVVRDAVITVRRRLLQRFLEVYPFQPATAVWRVYEMEHLLRFPFPAGRGLDLGCGDGLFTQILTEEVGARSLVGVDVDGREVESAKSLDLYERLHVTSGREVPEESETFDFVFSNSVLEHIPDIDPILSEVARVLRKGGTFLFTVPGPEFHRALRGPWLRQSSRDAYLAELDRRVAHHRYWTVERWRLELAKRGLRLEEVSSYLTRAEVRRWELLARLTAGTLYVVFRRQKSPIEIQRSLGLREKRRMLPWLAPWVGRCLTAGLSPGTGGPFGGLRIVAKRLLLS